MWQFAIVFPIDISVKRKRRKMFINSSEGRKGEKKSCFTMSFNGILNFEAFPNSLLCHSVFFTCFELFLSHSFCLLFYFYIPDLVFQINSNHFNVLRSFYSFVIWFWCLFLCIWVSVCVCDNLDESGNY